MNKKDIISTIAELIIGKALLALTDHIDGKAIENRVDALYWAGAEQVGYTQTRLPFTYSIWWTGAEDIKDSKDLKKLVKIYKRIKKERKSVKDEQTSSIKLPDYMGLDFYDNCDKLIKRYKQVRKQYKHEDIPDHFGEDNSKEVSE